MSRKVYPADVSDEEWESVAPYLTLIREDAAQRVQALRDVFDALRWMVKAGCPWRMLPGDFPPWQAVEQQSKRWMEAECFESLTHDLRELLRLLAERHPRPSAAILDGRTLQSSPESRSPATWASAPTACRAGRSYTAVAAASPRRARRRLPLLLASACRSLNGASAPWSARTPTCASSARS